MVFPHQKGSDFPLGITETKQGLKFCLYSEHAEEVTLSLYHPNEPTPFLEYHFDPITDKSNSVWYVELEELPHEFDYAYRLKGPFAPNRGLYFNENTSLCDPYAKALNTSSSWGERQKALSTGNLRGYYTKPYQFDWAGDKKPCIPLQNLIIYEMHVRAFTQDPSSKVNSPGGFLGVIEKIPYLQELGINAVELLPVFEFNECDYEGINPRTNQPLCNFWGYSTINFFTPMRRYGTKEEFQTMVKALHNSGIEVILDVVYNHTAEGNEQGPILSFRGIDNPSYYILGPHGEYHNYSGCGNTLNCNHPSTKGLIIDSLRYWAEEMHVDGFRFDLASILTRDQDGTPLKTPPVIDAITNDSILSKVKLIAEAWDCAGLYQVGSFPGQGKWSEWNGEYRDSVRRFLKGNEASSQNFASVLTGSEKLYQHYDTPSVSINFITAHDGFTLNDLVSYDKKHNIENGEDNKDGNEWNESWNCGVEGTTDNQTILDLREKQKRNYLLALFLSLGTPMLLMGDEYGHTRNGNNNAWCQDNALNWFQWQKPSENKSLFLFTSHLIKFRKNEALLNQGVYPTKSELVWHGRLPFSPNWDKDNHLVAYSLIDTHSDSALYIAFNAAATEIKITLPPPPTGSLWHRVIATNLSLPQAIEEVALQNSLTNQTYLLPPFSACLLKSKPLINAS
jgi:isoamylase/glycogen operon protein